MLLLLLLLLILGRWPASVLIASPEISSASTVVIVAGSVVVVIIVVHSHASSVHVVTPTVSTAAAAARGRRDETGPDPAPVARLFVEIKGDPGALIGVLLPSVRKRWNHRIFLAPGTDVPLLRRGQSHSTLLPLHDVCLVVQLEVLAELPSPALLFAAGGTVVRQIRVGVIVEESGHGERRKGRILLVGVE